ncbi:MAG: hypothetical protein A2X40_02485 [Elusimicrobia bacterium GWC2_65_9]|nr:MAG: hypothetical protein A2X37_08665 [Elusimicrobia bacterium GWA2_66_18]OGR72971.1 MAG: hypothetical protein A2X40_02485 [Elusimicrobia bacterium GWC2_65_9]
MNDEIDAANAAAQSRLSAEDISSHSAAAAPAQSPMDSVLLIDGDNDPHVPPDVRPTRFTLVRVFLRPGAKMPRTLEKKLSHLPHCATVVSPRGGANAADFVMSLHAGMLHATLPHHIPFLMVTNDATLSAMAAELQRLGRIATIWTSHPDAAAMSAEAREEASEEPKPRSRGGRSRGGRSRGGRSAAPRGGGRGRSSRAAAPVAQTAPAAPPPPDMPRKTGGKTLSEVAWTYAARLQRIKDVPSRLKTLLNDIKNRAGSQGFAPEEVLEELKRHHGVTVDASGRVQVPRAKPAAEETAPQEESPS